MKRDLSNLLVSLLFVALCSVITLGQETTGSVDITVKDAAGAVVPSVSLTLSSAGGSTGFKRTVTANDSGFARIIQVPPGKYIVTAAAISGFVEKATDVFEVGLGRTTPLTVEMTTELLGATVEVTSEVSPLDVTDTKIQTSISSAAAELLPKSLNVDSVLKFSPATNPEPRGGGFQIDGASGSENTFIIDGQEVTNNITGNWDANSRLPFSMIQEVQVKSSGFEAEYGGATGGVINQTTKGGGNEFRGEFGVRMRTSKLEPLERTILRSNFGVPEEYPSRYSQYNEFNPVAALGGPIWRNRVWFFVNYSPQSFYQRRELLFRDPTSRLLTGRSDIYFFEQRKEATFGRIDAQPFNRLRLTGTYNWNPITQTGALPSFASEVSQTVTLPPSVLGARGGRQNSTNFTGSGTYSVTNSLIVTARAGHYFLNEKLGTYGQGDRSVPTIGCANVPLSSAQFPANFGCVRGGGNGAPFVNATPFDVTTRNQYDADATYLFNAFGRHELKGGYQNNTIANDVVSGRNDQISLRWGTGPLSTVGAISGRQIPTAPGASGSGALTLFETAGSVSSSNEAVYVQDKWQPTNRLTLNLGLRTERENVPSYADGLPGIEFSFRSKLAPRLGAAYDLTGDGKTKVSAFYGLFYDRFKLELPRGSFGGDLFHTVYFDLFPTDTLANINRNTIFGGGAPIPGGSCPTGTLTPVFGRVRCDLDFRVPSNTGGPLTQVGGIDPDIKPFQQREITFTFERQLSRNYLMSVRYTRKQVLHAIEDAGFPNEEGSEYYIIGNPGEGLHKEQADMFGTLAPKAIRQYDALEIRLDKAFANRYFFNASYTFSRLYGNYSGLASSDEEGRLSPNVNRYFDQPHAGFTVTGGPDTGRLGTDRPHRFKLYGAYSLSWSQLGLWNAHTTDFQVFTTAMSGTVITSFVNINNISQIILDRRGDQGRTPTFTQTDFAVNHSFKFGADNRFTLKGDVDILNVFNQSIITNLGLNPSGQGGNLINTQIFDVLNPAFMLITPAQTTACQSAPSPAQCRLITAYGTFQQQGSPEILAAARGSLGANPFYNYPSARQGKRTVRFGLRLLF